MGDTPADEAAHHFIELIKQIYPEYEVRGIHGYTKNVRQYIAAHNQDVTVKTKQSRARKRFHAAVLIQAWWRMQK
jgi:cbb3-type cytochrome oxidase subunit 1